jgi:hypothetical protein
VLILVVSGAAAGNSTLGDSNMAAVTSQKYYCCHLYTDASLLIQNGRSQRQEHYQ